MAFFLSLFWKSLSADSCLYLQFDWFILVQNRSFWNSEKCYWISSRFCCSNVSVKMKRAYISTHLSLLPCQARNVMLVWIITWLYAHYAKIHCCNQHLTRIILKGLICYPKFWVFHFVFQRKIHAKLSHFQFLYFLRILALEFAAPFEELSPCHLHN